MISEFQQEQAALYALGLLDADEAGEFEAELAAHAELRTLVRELRDAAALLPLVQGEVRLPSLALRARVLAAVAPLSAAAPVLLPSGLASAARSPRRGLWLPWAIAALFLASTAVFAWFYAQQHAQLVELTRHQITVIEPPSARTPATDPLSRLQFCALEPTPDFATAQPRAAVLWDAARHEGRLRVNRLAPPAPGKDYQLWTVEAGRKDPVSAGVVHVNPEGQADVSFQPVDEDGKPVAAVAISLEQAGGSPTNQGPILLLGKL